MPAAPQKTRPWLPVLVIALGWYGFVGFLKLLEWLYPDADPREFALWLVYASPTLLVIGGSFLGLLLFAHSTSKRPAVPVADPAAFDRNVGKALSECLTRYWHKHGGATLAVNLADFERVLAYPLAQAAYLQPTWWTDESPHAQQWLAQGWRVLATQLTAPHPHVVFGREPAARRQGGALGVYRPV
jgi:hypothetical protein